MSMEDEDAPGGSEDPEMLVGKSERKRQREKQRRSDLANAFDELNSLLTRVDPEESETSQSKSRRRRKSVGDSSEADQPSAEASGLTRLDLIGRTIETIKKLHQENMELRQSLSSLKGNEYDEKNVYVMIPTLTPIDDPRNPHTSQQGYPTQHPYLQRHYGPSYDGGVPPHPLYGEGAPVAYPYGQHQSWRSSTPPQIHQYPPSAYAQHPSSYYYSPQYHHDQQPSEHNDSKGDNLKPSDLQNSK